MDLVVWMFRWTKWFCCFDGLSGLGYFDGLSGLGCFDGLIGLGCFD